MKKIILLLSFVALLYNCSSDSENSSNNNGNSFTNSMDYEFTITINGDVHKVKGNTINGIPKGYIQSLSNYINNQCEVLQSGGQKVVILKINDVTAPNYISGQNLECQILLPNLLLGSNQAQILFNGSYITNLFNSLSPNNLNIWQTTSGLYNQSISNKLPINITDLGTTSTNPNMWSPTTPLNFGQTLKGSYSGTVYLRSHSNSSGIGVCDIPVQLSIDFKALRMY
jgi:hypothetical protein